VVSAHAYVLAGLDARAPLTNQNVARTDDLAAVLLDSKALGLTVSSAPGATATFLVCHFLLSWGNHLVYCQAGVARSETGLLAISCLVLVLEHDKLLAPHRAHRGRHYFGACDCR